MTAPAPHPDRAEDDQAFERPPCEHHWSHRHHPGSLIYWIGTCTFCGDLDVEDINRQVRELPRAERAQPSGYTPPAVGAPTWPRERGTDPLTASDVAMAERAVSHVDRGGFTPRLDESAETEMGRLRAEVATLRSYAERLQDDAIRWHDGFTAERDRLRAVIAADLDDLLAGRVDEATAALRAAGVQP